MQVTIPWRSCVNADYFNNYGCPLFKTLKKKGVDVELVLGSSVLANGSWFNFNSDSREYGWTRRRMEWCARRHRSFTFDIPGLEVA